MKDNKKSSSKPRFTTNSVAAYSGVFLLILSLVAIGYQPPEQIEASANSVDTTSVNRAAPTESLSVDDIVATNVAANLAQSADLPVSANVSSLSQTISTQSVLSQNDSNIIAKPQIVNASSDTREIKTHVVKQGQNVASIAAIYNISSKTIKWANDLNSDAVETGRKLKILPQDGITYTVQKKDTIESIASKYKANVDEIKTYNDLDLGGLKAGKQLIIPEGKLPEKEQPGYEDPTQAINSTSSSASNNAGINYGSFGGGSGSANNLSQSGGNRYAFGNCTWYVYERRQQMGMPVGSMWGNAATWAYNASSEGYVVNNTPSVGSMMTNGGGAYGHVAFVESVNPGKSVEISEMNAYRFGGGFNRIGRGTIPWNEAVSGFFQYIK